MMAASRITSREVCGKHNIEFGKLYIPGTPEHEAFWEGACRECEADFRRERDASEAAVAEAAEIQAEAERRIAADSEFENRIRDRAAEDLREGLVKAAAEYCSLHRPEWEEYHRGLEWSRIVAEVTAEKKAEILERLREVSL